MSTTAWADPPPLPTRTDRYTRVAIALHWAIAVLIAYNLLSGLGRSFLPGTFFQFHVSSGLTILALSVVRVLWRLTHRPPPLLPMRGWERWLAHGVHVLLYAAMLLVPWTGWVMISASPPAGSPGAAIVQEQRAREAVARGEPAPVPRKPSRVWGLFPTPTIGSVADLGRQPTGVAEQRAFREQMEEVHRLAAWLLLFLLVLHIGGALKHQILDRLPQLARMGVGRGARADA